MNEVTTELRRKIDEAFGAVEVPPAAQVLGERYRNAIDPAELLAAFQGKHWRDIGAHDLFVHRESLSTLSAVGFRAYVAAYLSASLEGDDAADLAEYTLFALHPITDEGRDIVETRERLGALDPAQRAVIRSWLEFQSAELGLARKVREHWT